MRIFEPILGEKAASLRAPDLYFLLMYQLLSFYNILWRAHEDNSVATPTVGGLMKFAVKTVTCLGCKTPLRENNSVSSAYRLRRPYNTKSSSSPDRWGSLR